MLFLTEDECSDLINFIAHHSDSTFRKLVPICFFGIYYGLRRSEILRLKWDAIDFEKKTVRNFEIDAELIRRTRNAAKLTQEGLSEDICAQETLARIENGNQKPRSGNLRQMMEKMGRRGDRIE